MNNTIKKKALALCVTIILLLTAMTTVFVGFANKNNTISDSLGNGSAQSAGKNVTLKSNHGTINENNLITVDNAPENSMAITNGEEFLTFLTSPTITLGYVAVPELIIDWSAIVGKVDSVSNARYPLASNKTFDGNGNTVKLSPTVGGNIVAEQAAFTTEDATIKTVSDITRRVSGLFVSSNFGTIRNTVFDYNTEVADFTLYSISYWYNASGIICGINEGSFDNISLEINDYYKYRTAGNDGTDNGRKSDGKAWVTYVGGLAGLQYGQVNNITVNVASNGYLYNDIEAYPERQIAWDKNTEARSAIGFVAGRMLTLSSGATATITNVMINVAEGGKLRANSTRKGTGSAYRLIGAVVGRNNYGGNFDNGHISGTAGVLDNVLINTNGAYYAESGSTSGKISSNAVVDEGQASNVTIFNKGTGNDLYINNVNDRSNMPNYVVADAEIAVDVSFDQDGNQIIAAKYDTSLNGYLFDNKLSPLKTSAAGINIVDVASVITNELYNVNKTDDAINNKEQFTMTIPKMVYSAELAELSHSEISARVSKFATVEYVQSESGVVYSGKSLNERIVIADTNGVAIESISKSNISVVNTVDDSPLVAVLPGEYTFKILNTDGDFANIDKGTATLVSQDNSIYTDKILYATIDNIIIPDGLISGEELSVELKVQGVIENALDGYMIKIDDADFAYVSGMTFNTTFEGTHVYQIYGVKDSVRVTESYSFKLSDSITITDDDIVITNADKTYDGTTVFKGTIDFTEEFKKNNSMAAKIAILISFADANVNAAGTVLNIEFASTAVILDNQLTERFANIAKQELTVNIDDMAVIYNEALKDVNYRISGLLGEDKVDLQISTNYAVGDSASLTDRKFTVDNANTIDNYYVTTVGGLITINKKLITNINILSDLYGFTYNGNSHEVNANVIILGTTVDFIVEYTAQGNTTILDEIINAGKYVAKLNLTGDYALNYYLLSNVESINFQVKKADTEIIANNKYIFNGNTQEFIATIANDDNTNLVVDTYNQEFRNANKYSVEVSYNGNENYNSIQKKVYTLVIEAANIDVIPTINDVEYIYDGTEKRLTVGDALLPEFYNLDLISYENGFGTAAGVYKVLITFADPNYTSFTVKTTMTIKNADISGFSLEGKTVVYNGDSFALNLSVEDGINLDDYTIFYSKNAYKNPGTHSVTVTIKREHYNDLILTNSLVIDKMVFDGEIIFNGVNHMYDGTAVNAIFVNPEILDESMTFLISASATSKGYVNAGTYTAKLTINSPYYKTIIATAQIVINAVEVELVNESPTIYAPGEEISPKVYYLDKKGNKVYAKVTFGSKDDLTKAGVYKATATIEDSNYVVSVKGNTSSVTKFDITVRSDFPMTTVIAVVAGGIGGLIVIGALLLFSFKKKKVKV